MAGWFKQYPPNTPVRQVANIKENNLIRAIFDDLQGIGCRVIKPKGLMGRGWRIVVDGASDVDPIPDSAVGKDTGQIPFKPYDLASSIGVPVGACVWWPYDPSSTPIPAGWEEAIEMRGRYPVGFIPPDTVSTDTDFGSVGTYDGYRSHVHVMNLSHTHDIPPNVYPSPPNSSYPGGGAGDTQYPGDTYYNPCATYLPGQGGVIGDVCKLPGTPGAGSGGGVKWCGPTSGDTSDTGSYGDSGAIQTPRVKHLPPSFVGIWIRKL